MKNLSSKEVCQVSGGVISSNEIATVACMGTVVGLAAQGALIGQPYSPTQLLNYAALSAEVVNEAYEGLERLGFSKLI